MNMTKRINVLKAMDTMVRALNDEEWLELWLAYGIADGDSEDDEQLEWYCKDEIFADMMARFARIMRRATNDKELFSEVDIEWGNNIFYADGVASKVEEN